MKEIIKGAIWMVFFIGGGILFTWIARDIFKEIPTWENMVIIYMCGFLLATILVANYTKKGENARMKLR